MDNVLSRIGGEAGCRRLAIGFYARVAKSEELRPLFPGKSLRCASEEFAAFLIQLFNGDPAQTQYRWWLSLQESHRRFEVRESQRLEWLRLMDETVAEAIPDEELRQVLSGFFRGSSRTIVYGEPSAVESGELGQCWARQLRLEQIVQDLAEGRDAEAMTAASEFASAPSVFVGILARMMETGREPLIEFVVEAVRSHDFWAEAQFNGRRLLHHAAGHACVSVVQALLDSGIHPNLPDNGGHSALYRAASSRSAAAGVTVRALIRAGADVNQAGASGSTPLHQAARFGCLEVARILIAAGADVKASDIKGHTPLDRAVRCRRPGIAALLITSG